MSNLKVQISKLYQAFFTDMNIDSNTGIYGGEYKDSDKIEKRFATYPYIGSQYEAAKKKILFVGMDIGKDETPNAIQSFDERRENIEKDADFNPHIAGTYTSALYLLKDSHGWHDNWHQANEFDTAQQATKQVLHQPEQNPLSFIALSNFYKFVNVNRVTRSGDANRTFLNQAKEVQLFIDEVHLLKPELIIFQSTSIPIELFFRELDSNIVLVRAPHPSTRAKGQRQPQNYVSSFLEIKPFSL